MNTQAEQTDIAVAFEACLRRVVATPWRDLPASTRRRGALILCDNVAAAFSALDEPEVARARRAALAGGGGGPAMLLAPGGPALSVTDAAVQNGLAMGWNELDEGYRKAICHGGLYVLPALMAVAQQEGASARDLLRALVLAYELVTRVARAWRFETLRFHPHALLAPVGAAAGVAVLRGLAPGLTLRAVAAACAMGAAGPFSMASKGVLVRNAWAAQGAATGLLAVTLAQAGIGAVADTPHDVYAVTLGARADAAAFADDGAWAVEHGYQKLYACCQYAHSAIEAVQELLAQSPALLGGADVTDVQVQAHPLALALDSRDPGTTLQAKFSLPHAVAAAIALGHGGAGAFDSASLSDPRIARLRAATRIVPMDGIRPWPHDRPATVILTLRDGRRLRQTCWSARGGPDRPLAEQDIWTKITALCQARMPQAAPLLRALADQAAGLACTERQAPALDDDWRVWMRGLTSA